MLMPRPGMVLSRSRTYRAWTRAQCRRDPQVTDRDASRKGSGYAGPFTSRKLNPRRGGYTNRNAEMGICVHNCEVRNVP